MSVALQALGAAVADSFRGLLGEASADAFNPDLLRDEPLDKVRVCRRGFVCLVFPRDPETPKLLQAFSLHLELCEARSDPCQGRTMQNAVAAWIMRAHVGYDSATHCWRRYERC